MQSNNIGLFLILNSSSAFTSHRRQSYTLAKSSSISTGPDPMGSKFIWPSHKEPVIPGEKLFFGHTSLGHFTNETWLSTFSACQVYKDNFIKPLQARTSPEWKCFKVRDFQLYNFKCSNSRDMVQWQWDTCKLSRKPASSK